MEEDKEYIANNTDEAFVNGVLYGIMHCIELTRSDRIEGCKEGNKIAELVNVSLDGSCGKMFETFRLIRQYKRVPQLDAMVKELTSNPKYKEHKKEMAKTLDEMWENYNEDK